MQDQDGAIRPRRSALYVPAANARAIDKARTLACDMVILDLEDSVAPEAKAAAREQAVRAIGDGFGDKEVIVRINGEGAPWAEDVAWAEAVVAAFAGPDANGKGAIRLQGRMVERLHLRDAERLLQRAR